MALGRKGRKRWEGERLEEGQVRRNGRSKRTARKCVKVSAAKPGCSNLSFDTAPLFLLCIAFLLPLILPLRPHQPLLSTHGGGFSRSKFKFLFKIKTYVYVCSSLSRMFNQFNSYDFVQRFICFRYNSFVQQLSSLPCAGELLLLICEFCRSTFQGKLK